MSPWHRLQNLIGFGRTTRAMHDVGGTPTLQVQLTQIETMPNVQHAQNFGFSSSPPTGSNVVILFGAGDRSKGVAIASVDPATRRQNLVEGEAVVHDMWGDELHLSQVTVTIKHAALVTVDAPKVLLKAPGGVRIEGPLTVTQEVTAMCDGASVTLSQHRHAGGPPPTPGT